MARSAPSITLTQKVMSILEQFTRRRNAPQVMVKRAFIILEAAGTQNKNSVLAKQVGVDIKTVGLWRRRWAKESFRIDAAIEKELPEKKLEELIVELLSDEQRSGTPPDFTPEQVTQIIALACTPPKDCEVELSHWTTTALAKEAIKRNIVDSISPASVGRFLKRGRPKTPFK